jgi:hypothetical protein
MRVLETAKQNVALFHDVWQKQKSNLPQRRQVTERMTPISRHRTSKSVCKRTWVTLGNCHAAQHRL